MSGPTVYHECTRINTNRRSVVTVRGEIAVKDGKFVGKVGRGKLLKREPTHF